MRKLTKAEQRALLQAAIAVSEVTDTSDPACFSCTAVLMMDPLDDRPPPLMNIYGYMTGASDLRFGTHQGYVEAIEAISFETQLARSLCILLFKEAYS